jgi:hypothetical protein
MAVQLMA